MDLPVLPTDNLYKFVTVLGIVAAAFFVYMAHSQSREQDRIAADALAKQLAIHQEFAQAVARAGQDAPKLLAELDYRGKQSDAVMDALKALLTKDAERFPTVRGYVWLSCCSAAIALIGIAFWYVRFQRHMDRLVAKGKMLGAQL